MQASLFELSWQGHHQKGVTRPGSHLISHGSSWEENIQECLKSPGRGRQRAETIHTEWSACHFYTGMIHPGLWPCTEIVQEGSQLLLWCGSMQAIHAEKYKTLLIHSADLMGWHLPGLQRNLTDQINSSRCWVFFMLCFFNSAARSSPWVEWCFDHRKQETELISLVQTRDPMHPYQCLVWKQRENSSGFLFTPTLLTSAGVQKASPACSVYLLTPLFTHQHKGHWLIWQPLMTA